MAIKIQGTTIINDGADDNPNLGTGALANNTTGVNNTAVGVNALNANTTGTGNTAVGYDSLNSNNIGIQNTAVGLRSLHSNTFGLANTAHGADSLFSNSTGNYNTAVGVGSLGSNTSGISNNAIGFGSLFSNTTGISNTAVGRQSLYSNTTGSNNTALGNSAGNILTTGSNITVIGSNAQPSAVDATNEITLGDTNVTLLRIPGLGSTDGNILTYSSASGGLVLAAPPGGATVNDATITISAGSGLTTGGAFTTNQGADETITIDHADTSTQSSLTALTGSNVVSDIDLDEFGHVTNLATRELTLADLGYTGATNADNYGGWDLFVDGTSRGTITAGENVNFEAGTNVTLGYNTTNNTITITAAGGAATDTLQDIATDATNVAQYITFVPNTSGAQTGRVDTDLTYNPSSNLMTVGNITVTGDLTVSGTTTSINTETINLADNIITLNSNYTGSTPTEDGGIEIERGTLENARLAWNETESAWEIAFGGTTGRILTTGDEGAGNGLDADTLDGQQGTYYLDYNNFTNTPTIPTVNDGTITISAGSGLTTGGAFTTNQSANETITINHADTSTQSSLTALTGANVVSDIDLDGFGHVTNLSTRAITLGDLGYSGATNADNYGGWTLFTDGTSRGTITSGENVNFVAGTNVSLSYSTTNNTITINATDNNTTYTAGTALDLTGTTFNVNLSELTTSTTDGDGDYFVVVDTSNVQRKLTKGNINISGFNNDAGYTSNVGDITNVSAGTGLSGGGTSGSVTLSIDSTVATLSGSQTLTNKTLTTPSITGTITEDVYTISGTSVTLEPDNGSIQLHTLTGITTYSDGFSAGEAITLMIDDGTAYTITWPTITWLNNGGSAPTLATTGFTVVTLWKAGSTLYGLLSGDGT